ncbi:MAG: glutamate--tRNA ligase [Nitrospinota bacterium]|nr:glutamate--tRNA ligase [Nitrospinota bacterium]
MDHLNPAGEVKTRFAPSPTGTLHLGGARTALFNWLYARNRKGKFVLRIEDTDTERSTRESVDEILESMKWLGLDHDEGPYFQSERTGLYSEKVDTLLKEGKAYRCYCTKEELDAKREAIQKAGGKPLYDRKCRELGEGDVSKPHVIRFKMPLKGSTVFIDSLRGAVEVENSEMDDFVIRRTDGGVIYNLVVVIDDAEMGITNVIRGDDHIANTPKQVNLYKAFGYPVPEFTHVSMILGKDKKRLSKRHGADSVLALRDSGYVSDALVNMLARLGWSSGDQEVFSREEIVDKFSLANITMSSAVFDMEKLLWLNGQHIMRMDDGRLADEALPFVKKNHPNADRESLIKILPLLKERAKTLVDLADGAEFYFANEVVVDKGAREKFLTAAHLQYLKDVAELIEKHGVSDAEVLNGEFKNLAERNSTKMKDIAQPVRVALTGKTVSPGIFEMMSIIGKDESLKRIRALL